MTEISIKNFQSIKKVTFTIDGFTVITGKNNIGKSAIVRAIEAALTNQPGVEFIRKGEKSTEVKIKKDKLNIEWKKGTSATYKINGENFSKLNRAIPQPLIDAGFDKMEIGDQKISPIIASQFQPLFLLNKNGGVITDVLAHLYNIDTLSVADDLCVKELRSQKSLLKTREEDLKKLDENLEKYKDFDKLKKEAEKIFDLHKHVQKLQAEIESLIDYDNKIKEITQNIKDVEFIKKFKVPSIKKIEQNITGLEWLIEKAEKFRDLSQSIKKLRDITKITIPKIPDLESFINDFKQIKIWHDTFNNLKSETKNREKFIEEFNLKVIIDLSEELNSQIEEYYEFQLIEQDFTDLARETKKSRDLFRNTEKELEEKKKEMSVFKICPACERPL